MEKMVVLFGGNRILRLPGGSVIPNEQNEIQKPPVKSCLNIYDFDPDSGIS